MHILFSQNCQSILWGHIMSVYYMDIENKLRKTRLTYEHVHLTSQSRMRVYLATQVYFRILMCCSYIMFYNLLQVISATVANIMKVDGPAGSQETARFLELTDKFFDCVNGVTLNDKKPERRGYTSPDDPRFKVCLCRNNLHILSVCFTLFSFWKIT